MTRVFSSSLDFEREPLAAPWGFKGGFLTELWQAVAALEGEDGRRRVGLGTQSVLWCDPRVLTSRSEPAGNAAMLMMTDHALRLAAGQEFDRPPDLLDRLLEPTLAYGRAVTGLADLRKVFALNALVPVDNAAWMLWASANGAAGFDALIPEESREALSCRQSTVVSAPAVGYGLGLDEIVRLIDEGFFLLKIKLGSDPDRDGNPLKMMEWDVARMREIHAAVGRRRTSGSPTGHPLYYLDANGRYPDRSILDGLLDRLASNGSLRQTILLEEPFPENVKEPVGDLPVRVVVDESASNVEETRERIALGYGAVALKPIAKTLSVTFRIARLCRELDIPAFCADLTVNPILVDWNKCIAARLPAIPELDGGLQEVNGWQNYRDWERMLSYHPAPHGDWILPAGGRFTLSDEFYDTSGGALSRSDHYASLVGAI
jgi:hypothetical protein